MTRIKLFNNIEEAKEKLAINKKLRIHVGALAICLARTADGFYAIQDECPHMGESLSKGSVNHLGEIVCPWHSYRFRLKDGLATEGSCGDAKIYEIEHHPDGFFLLLDE